MREISQKNVISISWVFFKYAHSLWDEKDTGFDSICYNCISRRASVSSRLRVVGSSHSLFFAVQRMAGSEA